MKITASDESEHLTTRLHRANIVTVFEQVQALRSVGSDRIKRTQVLRHDMAEEKQDRSEGLILRALGHAVVDGLVCQERVSLLLTHLLGMNPAACPLVVKPHELRDSAPVGLDGARSLSPNFARSFILINELHRLHSAAHELLGQFARPIFAPTR